MPTLRDIKRRIKAVQSTRQITRAMKMVAASKFRKAQQRILEMRPYSDRMHSVISSLASGVETESHHLLVVRPRKKIEVIVITSDRGLCGAFNANILKTAVKHVSRLKKEGTEVSIITIGRKAYDFYRRRNIPIAKSWPGFAGHLSYLHAQEIAEHVIENYTNALNDEVLLIYNEFKSAIAQDVVINRLLPLEPIEAAGDSIAMLTMSYEPSNEQIFKTLLPKNAEIQTYRVLLESQASEEAARMTAMENATKSANDMIESLTLQYNKARQNAITKELMDIVGGVEALKE